MLDEEDVRVFDVKIARNSNNDINITTDVNIKVNNISANANALKSSLS